MSQIKVSPTRINLLKLSRELKVAKRGHKLLEDKRDGLMREFMQIVHQTRELRMRINKELKSVFENYISTSSLVSSRVLRSAFMHSEDVGTLDVSVKPIMSVPIPSFTMNGAAPTYSYGHLETYGDLDRAMEKLHVIYPDLIKLAELESSVERLAQEIERTRRRTSALEHIRIPALEEAIRFVRLRLEEQSRDAVISTMRVKDLITKKALQEA
ncbi:MAG: V-type ATP synthase subunit D [Anaplasmataceae bacterium]|nr:V-type ATP synthase subunit D [Anaplasmataceae bacterium]